MKTQRRRGFTVVELVVVIAIIAVLAAVLIPTFTSIIKKANDSAYLQERTNQKIEDLAEKVDKINYFTWEDFEKKLAEELAKINKDTVSPEEVKAAVDAALKEYAAYSQASMTGLTAEQVKKIVDEAMAGQLTTAQVEAIVRQAAVGKSVDVNAIANQVIAKLPKTTGITKEEMQSAIKQALAGLEISSISDDDIAKALAAFGVSTLTEADINSIISSATADNTTIAKALNIRLANLGIGKQKTVYDMVVKIGGESVITGTNTTSTVLDDTSTLLYDLDNNKFFTVKNNIVDYDGGLSLSGTLTNTYKYWIFANSVNTTYSTYLLSGSDVTSAEVSTGVDVGYKTDVTSITYTNTTAEQTVVIRTNGGTLTVNAEHDTVMHYGNADSINIIAVASASYHEYGTVGFTQIAKGHYVAEEGAEITVLLATGAGTDVTVDNNGAKIEKSYTTDSTAKETLHGGNESLDYYEVTPTGEQTQVEAIAEAIETLEIGATLFAGGTGSESDPFLIVDYDTFQHVSDLYEEGYYYFKVKDGVTSISLFNNEYVYLNGSLDGNNVVFTHVNGGMFGIVGTCDEHDITPVNLSNFTVSNEGGWGITMNCGAKVLNFINVSVTGYSLHNWNAGEFVRYGTGNVSEEGFDFTVNFIKCSCNAEIYSTQNSWSTILVGHTCLGGAKKGTINVDTYTNEHINDSVLYYTGTGASEGHKYYGMGGVEVFVDGVAKNANENKAVTNIVRVDSTKNPTKAGSGYSITTQADTTKVVVTLLWQYTEWTNNYGEKIAAQSGVGGTIGKTLTFEVTGSTDLKVFDTITNVEIRTGSDKWDYELKDGKLILYMTNTNPYIDGNVTLFVEQYTAGSNIAKYKGSLNLASKTTSSEWVIK